MNRREMKRELRKMIPEMTVVDEPWGEGKKRSIFLGTFMSLDPCGRYHHILSPNGITKKCEAFWERLEEAAQEVGGWTESGEVDPCDIYFCMPCEETEDEYNA